MNSYQPDNINDILLKCGGYKSVSKNLDSAINKMWSMVYDAISDGVSIIKFRWTDPRPSQKYGYDDPRTPIYCNLGFLPLFPQNKFNDSHMHVLKEYFENYGFTFKFEKEPEAWIGKGSIYCVILSWDINVEITSKYLDEKYEVNQLLKKYGQNNE